MYEERKKGKGRRGTRDEAEIVPSSCVGDSEGAD